MGVPFTISIAGDSPRLARLAETRALADGLPLHARDGELASVIVDARVVLDAVSLREAVARAIGARRAVIVGARNLDGTTRAGAATITPPNADDAPAVHVDDVIGTWLPGPDLRGTVGSPAVNLFTVAFGATGYAAVGRGLALGLRRAGVDARIASAWSEYGDPGLRADELAELRACQGDPVPGAASILIQPPVLTTGRSFLADCRAIATSGPAAVYTMFECDGIPPRWVSAMAEFERVWVPSTFNRDSFAAAGVPAERIDLVPIGIDAPRYIDGDGDFPLPNRRSFAFLSVFDWNERKGPDVLLRAWAAAFGPDDDVVLYLRTGASTVGAEGDPLHLARQLGLDPARMAPIEVLREDLPAARYEALFRSVDAFVLTSRGEAFCIPVLEAMAAGIPTIGTAAGGTTDFLDEATGFPIPARYLPVAPTLSRRISFYANQRWADPSVEATAAAMQRVVNDPAEASRRAAAGFARAQLRFDRRATALIARDAIAAFPARRRARTGTGAVVVAAPVRSSGAAAVAGRALAQALTTENVVVRIEDTGNRENADDGDAMRRLREAEHVIAETNDVKIAVDAFPSDANVVFLTGDPPTGQLRPGVEIWTPDAVLRERLVARGVPRARCRLVPVPLDVDRWTPDVVHEPPDQTPVVVIGGEPDWSAAAASVLRLFDSTRPVRLIVRGGGGTPEDASVISAELATSMRGVGTTGVSSVVLIPENRTITARAAVFGRAELVVAADPTAPGHEAARACGVPVIDMRDEFTIRLVASDAAERWQRARAERVAALARAASDRRLLREAFDAVAPNGTPVERAIAPTRIALRVDAAVSDREAIENALREHAVHTIVSGVAEAEYVVEVDVAVHPPFGWDELLINALESGTAAVVRAQRYDELIAPPGYHLPPYSAFSNAGALLTREGGHDEATAGKGLRLRRIGEEDTAGAWVVYGCLVENATAAALAPR